MLITGDNLCEVQQIISDNGNICLKKYQNIVSDSKILKSLIVSNQIVLMFENSISIYSFEGEHKTMNFEHDLVDISLHESGILFVLNKEGHILYTDIKSLFTEEISLTRKVNDFQDKASISIFFSEVEKALFVGLSTNTCYRIKALNICSFDEFDFSDKEAVEVS